jgi:hypothetical protein
MIDTEICAAPCGLCSFELSPIICKDALGYAEFVYDTIKNLAATSCVMFTIDITSIHLVNMSIATNKNPNLPGALGRTTMMSIPQMANGQERSMGQRRFACFVVCF